MAGATLQVTADVAPACRALPHALAALATSPPVRKLPMQDSLLLALLRLSHQQACRATETTAAASPLYTTGAESSCSGESGSADERGRAAAGGVGDVWRGDGRGPGMARAAGAGKALPNPWADDTVLDRLLVGIANGRDVASAAALHALCSVYRGVRESLVQHIHSDEWCVFVFLRL